MERSFSVSSLKIFFRSTDRTLLVLLLFFLDVKLGVKIMAIGIVYALRPDFSFGFRWKGSRLPLFYVFIMALALLDALLYRRFSSLAGLASFCTGLGFWLLSILAVHQTKLSVERNPPETVHNTILLFFALNIIFSFAKISSIMLEIGDINPYRFQGLFQKYFIGTGDYIKGVTFDLSTTNAALNAFAVVYFLAREKTGWLLAAMTVLLLTGSNVSNLLLIGTFIVLFLFKSTRNQKSWMAVCTAMLLVFLVKVSPQNDGYLTDGLHRFFVARHVNSMPSAPLASREAMPLSQDEYRRRIAQEYLDSISREEEKIRTGLPPADTAVAKPLIPAPSIHSAPFQRTHDTSLLQKDLRLFAGTNHLSLLPAEPGINQRLVPGKLVAWQQTVRFLRMHPGKIATGNGMGNFSSKLAFRTTALNVAGGYPARLRYINPDFRENHLRLFLSYFVADKENHSIINTPNSTYNQLLSEYGVAGLLAFLVFYAGFFASAYKRLTYGIPVFLIMSGMFFLDYWFEQLSVVVVFELLLLLNVHETKPTIKDLHA